MLGKKTSLLVGVFLWSTTAVFCGGEQSKYRVTPMNLGDVFKARPEFFEVEWDQETRFLKIRLSEELKQEFVGRGLHLDSDTICTLANIYGLCITGVHIQRLDLCDNDLTSLDLHKLVNVEHVDLRNNLLASPIKGLSKLSKLAILRLEENRFAEEQKKKILKKVPKKCWSAFDSEISVTDVQADFEYNDFAPLVPSEDKTLPEE